MKAIIICIICFIAAKSFNSCNNTGLKNDDDISCTDTIPWSYEGITELKRGDIIIRANSNFLPKTAYIEGGWDAGHAAIVTKGSSGKQPDSLLANSLIFESSARDLPREYQLRETKGLDNSTNPLLYNNSFSPLYKGARYRLRLDLPERQIDSIIEFIVNQRGSYSSWNAIKRYPGNPEIDQMVKDGIRDNWADNTHWYCSLLIWQAVFYITGIDLDANGGYFVYPNDLVSSEHFDNTINHKGRARF